MDWKDWDELDPSWHNLIFEKKTFIFKGYKFYS